MGEKITLKYLGKVIFAAHVIFQLKSQEFRVYINIALVQVVHPKIFLGTLWIHE